MISCVVAASSYIVDNLIELPYLNEPEILEALCQRYTQQLIYTYTGDDDDEYDDDDDGDDDDDDDDEYDDDDDDGDDDDDDDGDYNNLSHVYRQYPNRHQSAE